MSADWFDFYPFIKKDNFDKSLKEKRNWCGTTERIPIIQPRYRGDNVDKEAQSCYSSGG